MHGKEGRAMAAAETVLRSSSGLLLVRDNRRAHEAEEGIFTQVTLTRPTGSWRAWKLIMFNHRHGPRALLTCNFLGVTFLLLIVAGSYDALIQPSSTDVNSTEFVKGKSEFYSFLKGKRDEVAKAELQSIWKLFPILNIWIFIWSWFFAFIQ